MNANIGYVCQYLGPVGSVGQAGRNSALVSRSLIWNKEREHLSGVIDKEENSRHKNTSQEMINDSRRGGMSPLKNIPSVCEVDIIATRGASGDTMT